MSDDPARAAMRKELDTCLDNARALPDGGRQWPELFFAQPPGFRALSLSLAVPPGPGPHPLVAYIHGGGWRLGNPQSQHPHLAAMDLFGALHAAGFAVARVAYRLSAEGRFPTQVHDLKAALRYLRHHATRFGLDEGRFGVLGESAGGHLALMLGMQTPAEFEGAVGITGPSSAVQVVVAWYPVTDMMTLDAQALPDAAFVHDSEVSASGRLIGGRPTDRPAAARLASPSTFVSAAAAPTLLVHGLADRVVPPGQSIELHARLQREGALGELMLVEGAGHCFIDVPTDAVKARSLAFLSHHLRPRPAR